MLDLYFNKVDYFQENTSDNEEFFSIHFSLCLNSKKRVVMSAIRRNLNIFLLHLLIYWKILIGNLVWCRCKHCKNETGEIDCLYCRGVDAMLTALAKILEHGGSISPSSFYRQLSDYCISHNVLALST